MGDPAGTTHELIGRDGAPPPTLDLGRLAAPDRDRLPRPVKGDPDGADRLPRGGVDPDPIRPGASRTPCDLR